MNTSGSFIIKRGFLRKFQKKQIHGDPDECKDLRKFVLLNESINGMKSVLPISCHAFPPVSSLAVEPSWELLLSQARFILRHMIASGSELNPEAPSFYPNSCL